jgi:hypothetical protein
VIPAGDRKAANIFYSVGSLAFTRDIANIQENQPRSLLTLLVDEVFVPGRRLAGEAPRDLGPQPVVMVQNSPPLVLREAT